MWFREEERETSERNTKKELERPRRTPYLASAFLLKFRFDLQLP